MSLSREEQFYGTVEKQYGIKRNLEDPTQIAGGLNIFWLLGLNENETSAVKIDNICSQRIKDCSDLENADLEKANEWKHAISEFQVKSKDRAYLEDYRRKLYDKRFKKLDGEAKELSESDEMEVTAKKNLKRKAQKYGLSGKDVDKAVNELIGKYPWSKGPGVIIPPKNPIFEFDSGDKAYTSAELAAMMDKNWDWSRNNFSTFVGRFHHIGELTLEKKFEEINNRENDKDLVIQRVIEYLDPNKKPILRINNNVKTINKGDIPVGVKKEHVSVLIANDGWGYIKFNVKSRDSWLTIDSKSSFVLKGNGSHDKILLNINAENLKVGQTYNGRIDIISSISNESLVVTFTVTPTYLKFGNRKIFKLDELKSIVSDVWPELINYLKSGELKRWLELNGGPPLYKVWEPPSDENAQLMALLQSYNLVGKPDLKISRNSFQIKCNYFQRVRGKFTLKADYGIVYGKITSSDRAIKVTPTDFVCLDNAASPRVIEFEIDNQNAALGKKVKSIINIESNAGKYQINVEYYIYYDKFKKFLFESINATVNIIVWGLFFRTLMHLFNKWLFPGSVHGWRIDHAVPILAGHVDKLASSKMDTLSWVGAVIGAIIGFCVGEAGGGAAGCCIGIIVLRFLPLLLLAATLFIEKSLLGNHAGGINVLLCWIGIYTVAGIIVGSIKSSMKPK